jgi:PAS domain S-box-containing protein
MVRQVSIPKKSLGHLLFIGLCFAFLAYLLQSIVNTAPEHARTDVPLTFLSILVLLCIYVVFLLIKGRHLEEALIKYQAAIDASVDGISILNSKYECVYLNKSYAILYGYASHAELIGKPWNFFYPNKEISRFKKEIYPIVSNKGEWRGEAVGRKRDGCLFSQDISLTRMAGKYIVCIVRDITQHKAFEEELQRKALELSASNKELEAFGYSLSHDLRTPLNNVSVACQAIEMFDRDKLDEQGKGCLQMAIDGVNKMSSLIATLLRFSHSAHSELHREVVDLGEIAGEIIANLRLSEPGRQVTFKIGEGLTANVDPDLLKVVLENLLGNAWKFTRQAPDARLEFGTVERNGQRTFFVRDNGIGFDMQEACNLFVPFRRLQNAAESPGTGIGLSTVQRIMQRHGGKIWGEGELGKGASFFFTLPHI